MAENSSIRVYFIEGEKSTEINVNLSDNLADNPSILEVAHSHDISLEGACEGSLACSTCHVYFDQEVYDDLDDPTEAEDDMLDLAFGLTATSRLGCQIKLSLEHDGMKIYVPAESRNITS